MAIKYLNPPKSQLGTLPPGSAWFHFSLCSYTKKPDILQVNLGWKDFKAPSPVQELTPQQVTMKKLLLVTRPPFLPQSLPRNLLLEMRLRWRKVGGGM